MENDGGIKSLGEIFADARIVNEELARSTPCTCHEVTIRGRKREMCWSKGAIGVLKEEQVPIYCPEKVIPEKVPEVPVKPKVVPEIKYKPEECMSPVTKIKIAHLIPEENPAWKMIDEFPECR